VFTPSSPTITKESEVATTSRPARLRNEKAVIEFKADTLNLKAPALNCLMKVITN